MLESINHTLDVAKDAELEGRADEAAELREEAERQLYELRGTVDVDTLPHAIKNGLRRVGYKRKAIDVQACLSMSTLCGGGQGYRGFILKSNPGSIMYGSWGGANMFHSVACDRDDSFELESGQWAIKGSEGGGKPVYATVYAHPDVAAAVVQPPAELDKRMATILKAYSYKSSYRAGELARAGAKPEDTEALIAAGLLERKGRGIGLTTAGQNGARRYPS